MKRSLVFIGCLVLIAVACTQKRDKKTSQEDPGKTMINNTDPASKRMIVEASCGECQFDLPGKSCDLQFVSMAKLILLMALLSMIMAMHMPMMVFARPSGKLK
jgi:hypothetical protein